MPEQIDDSAFDSVHLLRSFLANRNTACPQCQYNLRDLRGDRCPECGEKLVITVNLAEAKYSLPIAGLVGLSAGAGMSGLLVIYLLIQILRGIFSMARPDMSRFLLVTGGGFVIEGIALLTWLRFWRRIRRASTRAKIGLVLGCWGLTLLNILIFSFTIR